MDSTLKLVLLNWTHSLGAVANAREPQEVHHLLEDRHYFEIIRFLEQDFKSTEVSHQEYVVAYAESKYGELIAIEKLRSNDEIELAKVGFLLLAEGSTKDEQQFLGGLTDFPFDQQHIMIAMIDICNKAITTQDRAKIDYAVTTGLSGLSGSRHPPVESVSLSSNGSTGTPVILDFSPDLMQFITPCTPTRPVSTPYTNHPPSPLVDYISSPAFRKQKMEAKEREMHRLQLKLQGELENVEELSRQCLELQTICDQKDHEISQLATQVDHLRATQLNKDEMEKLQQLVAELEQENNRLKDQVSKMTKKYESAKRSDELFQQIHNELDEQANKCCRVEKDLKAANLQVRSLQNDLASKVNDVAQLEGYRAQWEREKHEWSDQMKELREFYDARIQEAQEGNRSVSMERSFGECLGYSIEKQLAESQAQLQLILSTWVAREDFETMKCELETDLKQRESQMKVVQAELESEQRKCTELEDNWKTAREEVEKKEEKLKSTRGELKEFKDKTEEQLRMVKNSLTMVEVEKNMLEEQIHALKLHLDQEKLRVSDLTSQVEEKSITVVHLKESIEALKHDKSSQRKQIAILETELKELVRCKDELLNTVEEKVSERQKLSMDLELKTRQISESEMKVDELKCLYEQQIGSLRAAFNEKVTKCVDLESKCSELDSLVKEKSSLVIELETQLTKLHEEFQDFERNLNHEIENQTSENARLADDVAAKSGELHELRENFQQIQMESNEQIEAVRVVLEQKETRLAEFEAAMDEKTSIIIELESQLSDMREEFSEMEKSLQETIGTKKVENESLQTELEEKANHLQSVEAKLAEMQSQLEQRVNELSAENDSKEVQIAQLQSERTNLAAQVERYYQEVLAAEGLRNIEKESATQKAQIGALEMNVQFHIEQCQKLEANFTRTNEEKRKLAERNEELEKEMVNLRKEIGDMNSRGPAATVPDNEVPHQHKLIAKLKQVTEQYEKERETRKKYEAHIKQFQEHYDKKKEYFKQTEATSVQLKSLADSLRNDLQVQQAEKQTLEEKAEEFETKYKDLQVKYDIAELDNRRLRDRNAMLMRSLPTNENAENAAPNGETRKDGDGGGGGGGGIGFGGSGGGGFAEPFGDIDALSMDLKSSTGSGRPGFSNRDSLFWKKQLLVDDEPDVDDNRMSELQRRNTMVPPHLRSNYAVETQMANNSLSNVQPTQTTAPMPLKSNEEANDAAAEVTTLSDEHPLTTCVKTPKMTPLQKLKRKFEKFTTPNKDPLKVKRSKRGLAFEKASVHPAQQQQQQQQQRMEFSPPKRPQAKTKSAPAKAKAP